MDIAELGAIIAEKHESTAQTNVELADRLLAFFDSTLKHSSGRWQQLLMSPPEGVSIERLSNRNLQ